MKITDLQFETLDKLTQLEEGETYLIKCPNYCDSGYHVASLENGELISDSTGDNIWVYARAYLLI